MGARVAEQGRGMGLNSRPARGGAAGPTEAWCEEDGEGEEPRKTTKPTERVEVCVLRVFSSSLCEAAKPGEWDCALVGPTLWALPRTTALCGWRSQG